MDRRPPVPLPGRPSVAERAARRAQVPQGDGTGRYLSLLRTLRGEDAPIQLRRKERLQWHPVAWLLLRWAAVVVVAYVLLTSAITGWRNARVDVWSGPDSSVTSGQRLAGCPVVNAIDDPTFPSWVRFEGRTFRYTGSIRPVGDDPNPKYPATVHRLGDLVLYRMTATPEGRAGETILLKLDRVPVGTVYRRTIECE
jgi:hypothetical protein